MRSLSLLIVSMLFAGCAGNYSVKGNYFNKAVIQFGTESIVTAAGEKAVSSLKDNLTTMTKDQIAKRGDLILMDKCEPNVLMVNGKIRTLDITSQNNKSSGKYDITITGDFIDCGTNKSLGTFYQHEEGDDLLGMMEAISRDTTTDTYKTIVGYKQ